jgi:hypothetical protein
MKIVTLLRTLLRGGKRAMRCEACGNGFTCSVAMNCWCKSVKIGEAERRDLRGRFRDCLCPGCLETAGQTGADPGK